jgi:hypothetical protein
VTVDGPYGCPSKADLQQITKNRTDDAELAMVGQLRAYYLIPGNVVQVVQEDTVSGMSKIRAAGIVKDLWTFTKFLSRRPIKDTYGVIEIPETVTFIPDDHISRYGSNITFHTARGTAFPLPAPGSVPKPVPVVVEATQLKKMLGLTSVNYTETTIRWPW